MPAAETSGSSDRPVYAEPDQRHTWIAQAAATRAQTGGFSTVGVVPDGDPADSPDGAVCR
ncbi:MAG: hypothetical protein K0U78_01845 [Actinomycetia bacterium]|nr:hypothetical protein [Actinomycetes bacterium]